MRYLQFLVAALLSTFTAMANPEPGEWSAIQEDYRTVSGELTVVRTTDATIVWDGNSIVIENFYAPPTGWVKNNPTCNLTMSSYSWVSETVCNIAFRIQYLGETVKSSWTSYKQSVLSHMVYTSSSVGMAPSGSCHYKYSGGTDCTGTIDLDAGTITINDPWGYCIGAGSSWTAMTSTRVVEYFEKSVFHLSKTDLVDIINQGTVGEEYLVNDDLVGVAVVNEYDNGGNVVGSVLYAKDLGRYATPDVPVAGQFDYMETALGMTASSYDQSNWVAITGLANPNAYKGNIIKGKTLRAIATDLTNPVLDASGFAAPTVGSSQSYTPNVYIVPSFCDSYAEANSPYFFVQPKPQEWAFIQWATYNAADGCFYVPAKGSGSNALDLSGGFGVDWSYYGDGVSPNDNEVYNFHVICKRQTQTPSGGAPRRTTTAQPKVGSLSSTYTVCPLELIGVPTSIDVVNIGSVEEVGVVYYDMQGHRCSPQHSGPTIRVATMSDGTTRTKKQIK